MIDGPTQAQAQGVEIATMPSTVLIVEDDPHTVELVRLYLDRDGHKVLSASDGLDGLRQARESHPDLVVLDLMLPGMDGLEVCRALRSESDIPIVMVTARVEEEDRLAGLELGADDYITKPFSPNELAARVKAALRRSVMSNEVAEPTVQVGELLIDFASNRVSLGQSEVFLSDTEYRLLSYLARNAGRIVTRDQILKRIWGEEYVGEDHLLDVTIGRLRLKLEDQARRRPKYILTRRGIGYSFPATEESGAFAVGVG